jgi:hypothetical protein
MIWRCRPWFGCAWSSAERSGLAFHTQIEDDVMYLSTSFKEKMLSCIQVNVVLCVFKGSTLQSEKKTVLYRGVDKSLARPTSRCILFDGENILFDASLVVYINSTNIPSIMIINRIYDIYIYIYIYI